MTNQTKISKKMALVCGLKIEKSNQLITKKTKAYVTD